MSPISSSSEDKMTASGPSGTNCKMARRPGPIGAGTLFFPFPFPARGDRDRLLLCPDTESPSLSKLKPSPECLWLDPSSFVFGKSIRLVH
jgi:hypothetical protein